MKGTIFPRPFEKDAVTGARRPVKGSTWTYQFTVTRNGKRKTISKGGLRTRKLCEEALSAALADHGNGAHVEPSKMTVAEYLTAEWLPVVQTSKKPATLGTYRHFVERRINPVLGDIRLHELTSGDLIRFYAALRAGGRCDSKSGGLAERTIKQIHTIIHAALRHATESGLAARNVAALIPRDAKPKPRKSNEMRTWSAEEVRTFLEAVHADRLHACWAFAVMTGLRRSELLALKWQDIDLGSGQVSVRRGLVAIGADVHEGTPKSGRARTVAIDREAVALLKRHRTAQLEERMRWGEAWTDTGRVFTREDGQALRPSTVTQTFDRRVARLPVPRIRLHDLRHTHATLLLARGTHPKVVQERLGHSSVQITLDVYSHIAPGMQQDAAALIGAFVLGDHDPVEDRARDRADISLT
ncbi:MAG: site-specific integrase [Actinomycetota bacterium]|nr:site-specific integrase [Actinomycetota bacterium]